MTTPRFPRAKYRRQLFRMEQELIEWSKVYGREAYVLRPEPIRERIQDREEQLLDIAHTVARARYDLDVLPRLS